VGSSTFYACYKRNRLLLHNRAGNCRNFIQEECCAFSSM